MHKVEEKLKKLKDSKSPGADGIHPLILKTCAESIAKPLKIIFEKSLKEGKLPEWRKRANVTPILKKGCRSDRKNYRPVSLTSIICKILESFVRDGIMDYMVANGLLSKYQHGFVPRKSCVTNLLETLDYLTNELSKGNDVDEILLDLSKAFDLVPHSRLIYKIKEGYGVSEDLTNWIKEFLVCRKQRVVLG